jgi:hypothetical protein
LLLNDTANLDETLREYGPRGMLVAALSHEPMGEQAGSLIVQSASQKLDFCASPGD